MNLFRGILLIGIGVFSLYEGWRLEQIHAGQRVWYAVALGLVAIALGVWRLMRKSDIPRP